MPTRADRALVTFRDFGAESLYLERKVGSRGNSREFLGNPGNLGGGSYKVPQTKGKIGRLKERSGNRREVTTGSLGLEEKLGSQRVGTTRSLDLE